MSKRRFACWKCGGAMKKRGTFCKRCKKAAPRAVKFQAVMLTKSFGRPLRPVALPVVKAAKPVCPRCRAKGGRNANACTRCGTPFTPVHAARAEKAARGTQLSIVHGAAWWEAKAAAQSDPAAREECRAQAQKALRAAGQEYAAAARSIVKAAGGGSIREAWLAQSDPHTREVLRQALYGNQGGRPA